MAYGEHKAVLWGKLVTTAPETSGCVGCVFVSKRSACPSRDERSAGFCPCGSGYGHIYVEAKEDRPASAPQVGYVSVSELFKLRDLIDALIAKEGK